MNKTILFFVVIIFCISLYGYSNTTSEKPAVILVVFGAKGDLAARKVFPALYNLFLEKELNQNISIVGVGRSWTTEEFKSNVYNSILKFSRNKPTKDSWNSFEKSLVFHDTDFNSETGFVELKNLILSLNQTTDNSTNYIFYLATESSFFPIIINQLSNQGLIDHQNESRFSRVIIEKPFGEDLSSAINLQSYISQFLDESQIYRMDHYLGKEGTQKLLNFRFKKSIYDELLNSKYVKDVELLLSETIGIGTRAKFYEKTGHLRDVVQNHAMQILALAMMEAPASLQKEDVLKEKAKILYAIHQFPIDEIDQYAVRGQYIAGTIEGESVLGYREESNVPEHSQVETFVQLKLFIENERWRDVPVYVQSGKRLPEQMTKVVFNLNENPHQISAITVEIQPKSQIIITKDGKEQIYEIDVDPSFASREAYENLILASIQGDQSLFVTMDEVVSTWMLLTPVLHHWSAISIDQIPFYQAGEWGPEEALKQRIIMRSEGVPPSCEGETPLLRRGLLSSKVL